MEEYSKAELYMAMCANLDVQELRQLCLYLSYNHRLESLRYRKLWHDPDQIISDLLDLCERRRCLPLLITTLHERFPYVLTPEPSLVAAGGYTEADPYSSAAWDAPFIEGVGTAPMVLNQELEAARRNLVAQSALRAECREPMLNPPSAPVEQRQRDEGILAPANPLHWLRLLWWFVFQPRQLKEYRAGLNAAGEILLRRTAAWTISSFTFLPLMALWIRFGLNPGASGWMLISWPLVPLLLVGLWLGVPLLTPIDRTTTDGWGAIWDGLAVALSLIFGAGTGIMLSLIWWHVVPLLALCLVITLALSILLCGLTQTLEVALVGSYASFALGWLAGGLLVGIGVGLAAEYFVNLLGVLIMTIISAILAATLLLKLQRTLGQRLAGRYWRARVVQAIPNRS